MLRVHLALIVALGVLSSMFSGFATPVEISDPVTPSAQFSVDTLSSTEALSTREELSPQEAKHSLFQIMETVKTLSKNVGRLSDDVKAVSDDLKKHKAAALEAQTRLQAVLERSNATETSLSVRSGLLTQGIQDLSYSLRLSREQNSQGFDKIEGQLQDDRSYLKRFVNMSVERSNSIEASIEKQGIHLAEFEEDAEETLNAFQENLRHFNKSATSTSETLARIQTRISDSMKEIERALDVARFGHHRAFFHVENVTQRIGNASEEESVESDLFFIDGYTAKLRLDAELSLSRVSLGIYFFLCPGSKDSFLQWPLRRNYNLSIFHPSDPAKDVHRTAVVDLHGACSATFKKPKTTCNEGCGFSDVLSWESAEEGGYIHDDTITIGVTLIS